MELSLKLLIDAKTVIYIPYKADIRRQSELTRRRVARYSPSTLGEELLRKELEDCSTERGLQVYVLTTVCRHAMAYTE